MPGVDFSQLSSNWKRLQAQLKNEPKPAKPETSNGLKRKRSYKDEHTVGGSKATRPESHKPSGHVKRARMGNFLSKSNEIAPQIDERRATLEKYHDISATDLDAAYGAKANLNLNDVINDGRHASHKAGRYLAVDCEMVGTGPPPYLDDVLARVSVVNFHGEQIYDSYVLPPPQVKIGDYRTHVSGIEKGHLVAGKARSFAEVHTAVSDLLAGKILVGHALKKDLQVLQINHPRRDIRDTSRHAPYRVESKGKPPALRKLALSQLGMTIQTGEHSSLEDARAAMMLYKKDKTSFEDENRKVYGTSRKPDKKPVGRLIPPEDDEPPDEDEEEIDDYDVLDGEDAELDNPHADGVSSVQKVHKKRKKTKKRTKRK